VSFCGFWGGGPGGRALVTGRGRVGRGCLLRGTTRGVDRSFVPMSDIAYNSICQPSCMKHACSTSKAAYTQTFLDVLVLNSRISLLHAHTHHPYAVPGPDPGILRSPCIQRDQPCCHSIPFLRALRAAHGHHSLSYKSTVKETMQWVEPPVSRLKVSLVAWLGEHPMAVEHARTFV